MPLVSKSFPVLGMTCASCAISLETFLQDVEGVNRIQVNYASQQLEVEFESDDNIPEVLNERAKEIGYELVIGTETDSTTLEERAKNSTSILKKKLWVAALFSLPVFVLSMFMMNVFAYQNYVLMALTIPVIAYAGSGFFIKAWQQLKHGKSTMDTLVALSTGIAFLFSVVNTIWPKWLASSGQSAHVYYESAVVIITFILLGRYLEDRAKDKTKSAIQKLIGLAPKYSTVIRNGEEIKVETAEIKLGDLVIVRPGDKIPIDGKIKRGTTTVDESLLTGESVPIEKTKGSQVVAGSINQQGVVQILAQKVGEQTTLAEMIRMVTKAQNSKPKIQKQVDKIASIFVPIVIGVAVITAFVWFFFGPSPQHQFAITASITVLIVACPCALGLATPTALMVGIGVGSANGILIRDAQALETLHKADTIILDKTGTLTEGKPIVVDAVWATEELEGKYAPVLYHVEKNSSHPLADSIVRHFDTKDLPSVNVTDIENKAGLGMIASFEGQKCLVGSRKHLEQEGVTIPGVLQTKLDKWTNEPKTLVYFSVDHKAIAIFALGDELRSTSVQFIEDLKSKGIKPIVLSGDNAQTVIHVAQQLGVTQYKGNQSPEDKANYIKELQQSGGVVAMMGDGVNDAAALTQANVGIAMGSGSDVAMESAGITLMHSNPQHVVNAIHLSHGTIKTIRTNLFWAFIYNIVAIPIAAGLLFPINGFLLHPMIAGAAMSLSSVSVLLNSLRLKKIKI